jgi:DNA-binding beta-propeller fold protein YncE
LNFKKTLRIRVLWFLLAIESSWIHARISRSDQEGISMKSLRTIAVSLAAMLVAVACLPVLAQAQFEVLRTMHIGGEGGWDYVTLDPPNHRLFVTRSTHTMAIDTVTGKVLGDIPGQKRSHGTALVPELGRGFITDGGGSGAIVVFDLKTYAVLGTLAALPDADGIIYDKADNLVLAVSGDGNALITVKPNVDPKNGKIDPPIELGGAPEFLGVDGGKAYVNLENKDQVAVVDLKTRKVLAHWPVAPGGRPVGMAVDPKAHVLFIGCRNPQKMIVMSDVDGKVLADLPIGAGVDATKFNAGLAFASTGDGNLTVVGEKGGKYEVEQTVKTAAGARTMGVDAATGKIYLPTAEFEPPTPGAAPRRPQAKPDSFMILEVGGK